MSQLWLECCYLGCHFRVLTKRIEERPACSLAASANSCWSEVTETRGFTVSENVYSFIAIKETGGL